MRKKVVAMALVCGLLIAVVGYASADPVNVGLIVGAAMPQISGVAIHNGSHNVPLALDVNTEYHLHFTVTCANRMFQMQGLSVELYDNAGSTAVRSYYEFHLSNFILNPTWISSQGAQYYISDPTLAGYNLLARSHSFELHFRVDRTARPTGVAGYWHAEITATRNPGNIATDDSTSYDVNKYAQIDAQTNSIDFGTLDPGDPINPRQSVDVTFTSNTELDITVTGADLDDGGGNTIPVGSFDMQRDDSTPPTPIALTLSAQDIYEDLRGTNDNVGGLLGYSNSYLRGISFGGTVPDPTPAGTYTGQWQVNLDNSAATPT